MYDIRSMKIWKEEPPKKAVSPDFERTEISEMNLSVRSFNCLKRAGCNTVGDILRIVEDEESGGLRKIRNLGHRSEEEILENVEKLKKEYAARPGSADDCVKRSLIKPSRNMWSREISDFHLSRYAAERLQKCGITKVQDLYATDPKNEPGWYAVRELFGEMAKEL